MTDEERKAFSILNDRLKQHAISFVMAAIAILILTVITATNFFHLASKIDAIRERLDAPTTQRTTP